MKYEVLLLLRIIVVIANSVDTDEMLHFAAFILGIQRQMYHSRGIMSIIG